MAKKIIFGALLVLVILTASIYFLMPDKMRIDIENTRTKYYVYEDGWVLAATEYVNLFDGTTKMRAKSRNVTWYNDSQFVYAVRTSVWKDEIKTIQTYTFGMFEGDIENVPIKNEFECINCQGKIVHYEIRDILYTGETKNIISPFSFGHNMNIEWEDEDFMWAKVYQQSTVSDKIIIRYRPDTNDETYYVRIFDPPIEGNNLIIESGQTITLGGLNDTYDTVYIKAGGTLNVNTTNKYLNLIANNITIYGTVNAISMYSGGTAVSCASSSAARNGGSGTSSTDENNQGYGGSGADSDWFNHGLGGGGGGNAWDDAEHYTSSCDGHYYANGDGGGYCGAFDIWKRGGRGGYTSNATISNFIFSPGAGGGGGGCRGYAVSGAGGAGAGTVVLIAPIINVHGTVNLYGSAGSNAGSTDGAAGGGGGGSGGAFAIFGKSVDISSSTFNVAGGSGGAASANSGVGTGGGGGSGGRIKVYYETIVETSVTKTLGTEGTYFATETAMPISLLVSNESNFTTGTISASCNNTMNSYGSNNYAWSLYLNDVLNQSDVTDLESGYVNVYNITPSWLYHNDTWKLKCKMAYGEYNVTDTMDLQTHQPIWINITSPLNGSSIPSAEVTIYFDYENYTDYDSCWYNNGTINISNACDGLISPVIYDDGEHTIIIYSNSSDGVYEFSDNVTFTVAAGDPNIKFVSPTPDNATWLNINSFYVKIEIGQCLTYKNSTFNLWNATDPINTTTYADSCSENNINWTDLSDGEYNYNVTTYDIYNRTNSTETRTAYIDTTFPLIDYAPNSDVENTSADFTIQDWIFINISVTELNEANTTFILWNSTSTINTTISTLSQREINWTGLSPGMYFYNVTICDYSNNCNTTATRNYGIELTNETLNLEFFNQIAELGTPITINATNNLGNIFVDILHPDYGTNYSSGLFKTGFDLIISYFRNNLFYNGNEYQEINFNELNENSSESTFGVQNMRIPTHQYDYIENLSINISGNLNEGNSTRYEPQLIFYKANTTEIDRAFYGDLIGNNIFIDKVFDNSNGTDLYINNTNVSFENLGDQLIYLYLDRNAKLVNFVLNITGFEYGFTYNEDFSDSSYFDLITTTARRDYSDSLMFKGTNLLNKVFDDFGDASFNTTKFDKTADYSQSSPSYSFSISETGGYARIYNNWDHGGSGYNFNYGEYGFNSNIAKFNLRDSQNIILSISSAYSSNADNEACSGYSKVYLGGTVVWTSKILEADWDGSNQIETANSNVTLNLTKLENGNWKVRINGTENALARSVECGDDDHSWLYGYYYWDTSSYNLDYSDSDCADSSGNLNNDFEVSVNYNSVAPLYIVNKVRGTSGGCKLNSVDTRVYYINNSIYNISNSSFYSESIFDSSADIVAATMTGISYQWYDGGDDFYYYLSADDGENWEGVSSGVEHNFINPGKNIKYRIDMNTTNTGYRDGTTWIESVKINTTQDYPSDVSLDFGNDGIYDYTMSGELNETSQTANLTLSDISSAFTGNPEFGQTWLVPLRVYSATAGIVQIDDINLTYNPNPVYLDITAMKDYQKYLDGMDIINFSIGSVNGTLNLIDLRYDYRGGNKTYSILAHNSDYSQNVSRNITYYYSSYLKNLPYNWVEDIFFLPRTNSSKNVSAYGQTTTIPILNITSTAYGGKLINFSVNVDQDYSCINLTWQNSSTKPTSGNLINTTYFSFIHKLDYLDSKNIWLWVDLENCNASEMLILSPKLNIESYCEDCIWE